MSDFEDFEGLDEAEVREELTRKLRTEGAKVAVTTAIDICKDPQATSAAKASAVNSLLRANGFFDRADSDEGEKDEAQMTPAEVQRLLQKARRRLVEHEARPKTPKPRKASNVFE